MKRLCLYMLVAYVCLLSGCTQNDGHIGPVFGSWALTDMTEDGLPADTGDETVVCFQNEIVKVVRLVNPPYSVVTRYGNFSLSDDVLTMKFQVGPTPSGSYMYMAPEWLHFPQDGEPIHFRVVKLNGSEMKLSLETDGKTYVYSFKKTW
ncbi:MAG: lipocalin-like domain-containing protein [Muribaculaceae bacterium]|nr:lipocalin-like domain-containing protein [Muribaculaceae bacterium]